jgi:hypothetical protein
MPAHPFALARRFARSLKLYSRTRWVDGSFRLRTPDRIFLEETIFPWLRDEIRPQSVIDVGCDWYTRAYPRLLGADRYDSIDIDPAKARFAQSHGRNHVTASLLELDRHREAETYDIAIFNGVIGWGINDEASICEATRQITRVMRPGAWLILGWNDTEEWRPATLAPFDQPPLERRAPPPVGADTLVTATKSRHTYRFFVKSDRPPPDR